MPQVDTTEALPEIKIAPASVHGVPPTQLPLSPDAGFEAHSRRYRFDDPELRAATSLNSFDPDQLPRYAKATSAIKKVLEGHKVLLRAVEIGAGFAVAVLEGEGRNLQALDEIVGLMQRRSTDLLRASGTPTKNWSDKSTNAPLSSREDTPEAEEKLKFLSKHGIQGFAPGDQTTSPVPPFRLFPLPPEPVHEASKITVTIAGFSEDGSLITDCYKIIRCDLRLPPVEVGTVLQLHVTAGEPKKIQQLEINWDHEVLVVSAKKSA